MWHRPAYRTEGGQVLENYQLFVFIIIDDMAPCANRTPRLPVPPFWSRISPHPAMATDMRHFTPNSSFLIVFARS